MQKFLLIVFGVFIAMSAGANATNMDFEALLSGAQDNRPIPERQAFTARDGATLAYRHYPGESRTALVLLHGSGSHSQYLATLAHEIAESGAATVYTPDIRGHGPSPANRGDIDYIEQLEDDLADLIAHIKTTDTGLARVIVGGHSAGGGLAMRFAGGKHGDLASGYLLLAPYLGYDAPTVRRDSGGWANPSIAKIIGLSLLNELGVTRFNDAQVLRFNMPAEYRDGSETLTYSYRLMSGFNPSNFRKELGAMEVPVLVITGAEDNAFFAEKFEPTIRPLVPHADIITVEGVSHLGLVVSPDAIATIRQWLEAL
ncbi:alpha/beta hydrolase [Halopseudomonas salegens]|uniref:Lysophospholipase, alpha-beta hydrolase superfamily n=1 Tax=Halopseudomonas salegens TaxID=1434072 RepID=A0A1H2F3Y1_9GAMM|nr:alpha/beta hydrolase [Halopseudomonas salegens]SDU02061.1 Lysophospholipase, alpha-beta hydrolase superfamily [Halopseudomonas salegens]